MTRTQEDVRTAVRSFYGEVAASLPAARAAREPGCLLDTEPPMRASRWGIRQTIWRRLPRAPTLAWGVATPARSRRLLQVERVLDLGSGGGFDCFLAAKQVGPALRPTKRVWYRPHS